MKNLHRGHITNITFFIQENQGADVWHMDRPVCGPHLAANGENREHSAPCELSVDRIKSDSGFDRQLSE